MLTIVDGGLSTTVQDLGRPGHYAVGIPPSGAMDTFAHTLANELVGNPPNAATLEATLRGPKIRFDSDIIVAITGADVGPTLNGAPIPMWESFHAQTGDLLETPWARLGCRAYIAVSGGIEVPLVLGSRSTYTPAFLGGYRGRRITDGARLETGAPGEAKSGVRLASTLHPAYPSEMEISVILGPQDHLFTDEGIATFLGSEYRVSAKTDRMASRLSGPVPEVRDRVRSVDEGSGPTDIIEDGNAIGTIQIAGGTEPIIMLRDAPSTGAYAKIATLITADVETMAQARPGDKLHFQSVNAETARERLLAQRRQLAEALESLV